MDHSDIRDASACDPQNLGRALQLWKAAHSSLGPGVPDPPNIEEVSASQSNFRHRGGGGRSYTPKISAWRIAPRVPGARVLRVACYGLNSEFTLSAMRSHWPLFPIADLRD